MGEEIAGRPPFAAPQDGLEIQDRLLRANSARSDGARRRGLLLHVAALGRFLARARFALIGRQGHSKVAWYSCTAAQLTHLHSRIAKPPTITVLMTKTAESKQKSPPRENRTSVPDAEPVPIAKGSHVYLVDGSGYIFRAFHALPPLTRPSDGLPVGAVHGFCQMLWKLMADTKAGDQPTHLAVIFDAGAETFRNEIFADYKANRPPPPEELVPQFPLIRDAVKAFNVPCVELPGFEADDLIATYAQAIADAGGEVTIVSSDKDLMQLVQPGVDMLDTMKTSESAPTKSWKNSASRPDRVVDVQSLAGDSVDNVPGVPGIGVKTAAQLIQEYGDLDSLLERAGEIKQPKRREKLIEFADQARISRDLVRLKQDVPGLRHTGADGGARTEARCAARLPNRNGIQHADAQDRRSFGR